MADYRIEKALLRDGYGRVAGVDEAGRGALFGPVVAAAVSFSPVWFSRRRPPWARRVDDSKRLRPALRAELATHILAKAEDVGIGISSNAEIDGLNIFKASQLAMKRAVADLSRAPEILLVDGVPLKEVEYAQMGVPQGDRKSFSVAAASIIAKVFRDDLMDVFDAVYRGYGLARHKGYGTDEHFRRLRELGPTVLHRMSFRLR